MQHNLIVNIGIILNKIHSYLFCVCIYCFICNSANDFKILKITFYMLNNYSETTSILKYAGEIIYFQTEQFI